MKNAKNTVQIKKYDSKSYKIYIIIDISRILNGKLKYSGVIGILHWLASEIAYEIAYDIASEIASEIAPSNVWILGWKT